MIRDSARVLLTILALAAWGCAEEDSGDDDSVGDDDVGDDDDHDGGFAGWWVEFTPDAGDPEGSGDLAPWLGAEVRVVVSGGTVTERADDDGVFWVAYWDTVDATVEVIGGPEDLRSALELEWNGGGAASFGLMATDGEAFFHFASLAGPHHSLFVNKIGSESIDVPIDPNGYPVPVFFEAACQPGLSYFEDITIPDADDWVTANAAGTVGYL